MTEETERKMEEVLKNEVADRHSLFQLKYFVLGREPTVQAKMWRCLRELKARKESMDAIRDEIEEAKGQDDFAEVTNEGVERRNRRIARTVKSLEHKLKGVTEEADFFLKAFEALEKKEKLKPYDDFAAQAEYWNEKLHQDFAMKMILGQPIDIEVAKTILCLDDQSPVKKQLVFLIDKLQGDNEKRREIGSSEQNIQP